ncbi:MAG TPA: prephenate dehydratase domain-containing protein [Candidatus Saccharimonadales bacterium]|nr:prephenate dehydratase domain-containing protein [Candidatus Saccharimonadales bacterium]
MIVAIQGQAGSFHEQAAQQWYGASIDILPCTTFGDVFDAYANGDADAIVTAVENTLYGSINQVYQYIEDCEAPIVGEIKLAIKQMLIGLPGTKLSDITEVYSHPVALAQCRKWLAKHLPRAELIEFFDTAGAVEYVKNTGEKHMAAIAGEQAAELYKTAIIQPSIQDNPKNITRFLVLEPSLAETVSRSSLVITTSHKPGALVEVLQVFADANINLVKLQSQPIIDQPWHYKFFMVVDCAGEQLYKLVERIEQNDHQVTLLGEYKAA